MDDFLVEKRKQRFGHKEVLVECDLADLLKKTAQKAKSPAEHILYVPFCLILDHRNIMGQGKPYLKSAFIWQTNQLSAKRIKVERSRFSSVT